MNTPDAERILKLARISIAGKEPPPWYPKHNREFTIEGVIDTVRQLHDELATVNLPKNTKEYQFHECWGLKATPPREDVIQTSLPINTLHDMQPDLKSNENHFFVPGQLLEFKESDSPPAEKPMEFHADFTPQEFNGTEPRGGSTTPWVVTGGDGVYTYKKIAYTYCDDRIDWVLWGVKKDKWGERLASVRLPNSVLMPDGYVRPISANRWVGCPWDSRKEPKIFNTEKDAKRYICVEYVKYTNAKTYVAKEVRERKPIHVGITQYTGTTKVYSEVSWKLTLHGWLWSIAAKINTIIQKAHFWANH